MPTPTPERKPLSVPQKALRKMGLLRPVDLALHLPMRYEDETQLVKLADSRDGEVIQIEAVVKSCQVVFKPRRQLQAVVDDGSDTCTLRFFNFYPNMQKALEEKNITPISAEVEWIPGTTVPVTDEQAEDISKLLEKLEQDEDVQKVFHNMG